MRYLAVLLGFLSLAGCSHRMDQDAIVGAAAIRGADTDLCYAATRNGADKTAGTLTECMIAAEMKMAAAIKLKNTAILDAYRTRARLAASQRDAGQISIQAFADAYMAAENDYRAGLRAEFQLAVQDDIRRRNAAMAFAVGVQDAGAAMQASAPPPNPAINCRSYRLGNTVQTNCN